MAGTEELVLYLRECRQTPMVLALGLLLIRNALEGVRRRLEPVALMVPTIEAQTGSLGVLGVEFARQFQATAAELAVLDRHPTGLDRELRLRGRRRMRPIDVA